MDDIKMLDNNQDLTTEALLRLKESIIQVYLKYVDDLDKLIEADKALKNTKGFIEKRCELTRDIKLLLGEHGLL